jgi:hypothetical protein
MNLSELHPRCLKLTSTQSFDTTAEFKDCDGIIFLCPVCFRTNNGPVGTHSVICFKPHVPLTVNPGPGRWSFQGTSADDLTLVAGSSSVLLDSDCKAHFFIRSGEIINC